MQSYNQGSQGY